MVKRRRRLRRAENAATAKERFGKALEVSLVAVLLFGALSLLAQALGWSRLSLLDGLDGWLRPGKPLGIRLLGAFLVAYVLTAVYALGYALLLVRIHTPWPSLILGVSLWALVVGWHYPDLNTRVVTLSLFVLAALMIGATLANEFSSPER